MTDHVAPAGLPGGLGAPARRALAAAGYTHLEQFTTVSQAELRQLHGVGEKAIALIGAVLADHGMAFRS